LQAKVIILVNNDFFFYSHRLSLARAARQAGYGVSVATRVHEHADRICAEGFTLHPLRHFIGDNLDPVRELRAMLELRGLYRRERPRLVHHIGLKMSVTGSLAARAAGVDRVLNTFTGLGYLFTGAGLKAAIVRGTALRAMKTALKGRRAKLCFQNDADRREFVVRGFAREADALLVRGSGVNVDEFAPAPFPPEPPVVLFASRMLADKGPRLLVEAARLLRERRVACRVLLAGMPDPGNPRSLSEAELRRWHEEGSIEWLGGRTDMPALIAASHIVCLPTYYREGLPRILLEAAACARPIVATDIPGCRELVTDGVNGLLVPVKDANALAAALERLIADPALGERMGRAGREKVVAELSDTRINEQTLGIYGELIAS